MTVKPASVAIALALILTALPASLSRAHNAGGGDGQRPATDQASRNKPDCVTSKAAFRQDGSAATIVIELQNGCETRLKCKIDAYVVGARGPTQGHSTLILAPKSEGASAGKSYTMPINSTGGMASVSHECELI